METFPAEKPINDILAAVGGATASEFNKRSPLYPLRTTPNIEAYIRAAFAPPNFEDLPVVTVAAGEETALSSPQVYKPYICGTGVQVLGSDGQGDPKIRFSAGEYFTSNGVSADLGFYGAIKPGGAAQFARWPFQASFVTSAGNSVVEIGLYSLNATHDVPMIEVEGRRVSDFALPRYTAGNGFKVTLTFPNAKARRIKLFFDGAAGLTAIRVPTGNTITKGAAPARKIALVGDSFMNGAGVGFADGAGTWETFGPRLAHLMGATEILCAGIGGTGFVAGGAVNAFYTRLAFVLSKNPDVIIFNGSINDGAAGTGVQAAVESALATCAAVSDVYLLGTMLSGYGPNHDAVEAAANVAGRPFVNLRDFINGGNRGFFLMNDNAHPTFSAHVEIANAAFRQIGFKAA